MSSWKVISTISTFTTPWLVLIGERVLDDQGSYLDYWRIEKNDSIIVIPIYQESFVLPAPFYRHGINEKTLDFPGGRKPRNFPLHEAAVGILERELGVSRQDINSLEPINTQGWSVNSSFSNQLLYGFTAKLSDNLVLSLTSDIEKIPIAHSKSLLQRLYCLQCRSVLLEWMLQNNQTCCNSR